MAYPGLYSRRANVTYPEEVGPRRRLTVYVVIQTWEPVKRP
jgi:hypothetical protein